MPGRPLVAVAGRPLAPQRVRGWADPAVAIQETYLAAIRRAGGHDATLDPFELGPAEARELLARFDALVLTGGDDVDPATYGEEPHPEVYGTHPLSDRFELALLRAALDGDVAVLAICRGIQILNVAFGGSLDQHITGRPGLIGHGVPGRDGRPELHAVDVDAGSRLAAAMGGERVVGSSHHHQAVGRLGEGLRVTARAPDGVVEGLELPGARLLAVQWHPEDTAADDPVQQRLFDALVADATS